MTMLTLTLNVLIAIIVGTVHGDEPWPKWGGPNGDFKVQVSGLANRWTASGPKVVWERPLGEGFSSIVADASNLYTMYRNGDEEVVVAIESGNGKTLWEHRYAAPLYKGKRSGYLGNTPEYGGVGPRATPLVNESRLYTIGYTAKLHCLNSKTGEVFWSHDLIQEFNGWIHECGYSASPVMYKNVIILILGSSDHGVIAFHRESGEVAWKSPPFSITMQESQGFQATPLVITVDGEDQLVFMSPTEVIGLDPTNGQLKWRHPHKNHWQYNCVTPLWGGKDGLLYVTSHANGGSRVVKLSRKNEKTVATQLWHNPRIGLYHNNGVRVGDYVYGCSGSFLFAQGVTSGKVLWKERDFSEGNLIYTGDQIIVLDERGLLTLATATPNELKIHSRFQLFAEDEGESWTPPSLVGTTLYARNRHRIIALALHENPP